MQPYALYVLGPFHVTRQGRPVTDFRSDKARALLTYLALNPDRPHRRDELAYLLWPDVPDEAARRNLRLTFHRLRRTLGDQGEPSSPFVVDRDTIRCRAEAIWVDARAFEEQVMAVQRHDHETPVSCPTCMETLAQAISLYRGEFLQGLSLKDAPAFAEWAVLCRERWHLLALMALFWLTEHHRRRGHLQEALHYARRQVELGPWREEAHRQLMDILARLGEVSGALAQYETCRRLLAQEFGVPPEEETQRLYRRICRLRQRPHRAAQLPVPPTAFVGREEELAWLGERLIDPQARLITVTGPPGVGKTRLALQAAQSHAFAFLHGVCFVPLTGVDTVQALEDTLAGQLGCAYRHRGSSRDAVLSFLREREILLLLDGFEGLLARPMSTCREVAVFLDTLLQDAPHTKLLITSREPLHLQWEWRLHLEGLPYPVERDQDPVDPLALDAVRLFVLRAQQVRWDLDPEQEMPHIVRICRLVEGMPLAVELAAAWADRLSCGEIARRVEQRLDFLVTPFRDVPPGHRSLRAACASSWQLLSAEEQRAWRGLSVFAGSFTAEAAWQIVRSSSTVLDTLVDKSLLQRSASARYTMHELLREFAAEKLREAGESAALLRSHTRYYARRLQSWAPRLCGPAQQEVLDEIRTEWPDVRAAWTQAVASRDKEAIAAALEGLYHFLELSGRFREGEVLYRQAATAFAPTEGTAETETLWGRLLVRRGWFLWRLGRYREAQEVLQRGGALAHRRGDMDEEALAWGALGLVRHNLGQYEEARRLCTCSLALYRRRGNRWGMVRALGRYGLLRYTLGEWEEAQALFAEGLEMARGLGEPRSIAFLSAYLGLVACELGDYTRARACCEAALAGCRQMGDEYGVALAMAYLGRVLAHLGEHDRARSVLREALARFRELGDGHAVAYTMVQLGEACRLDHDFDGARVWYEEGLEAYRAVNSRGGMAEVLGHLGYLAFVQGDWAAAQRHFREGLDLLAAEQGAQLRVAFFRRRWGEAMEAVGV